jgi:predicted aspartyl protease
MTRPYALHRRRGLRFTNGALHGPTGVVVVELLVDTGAAFSLLSPAILRAIGIDPIQAVAHQRIATANGYIVAPVVIVPRLECLGQRFNQYRVLAHALPFGSALNGVLGMDFLERFPLRFELDLGVILERMRVDSER